MRRFFAAFLAVLMVLAVMPPAQAATGFTPIIDIEFPTEEENLTPIYSYEEFAATEGNGDVILMADITCPEEKGLPFTDWRGILDGNGHSISNLKTDGGIMDGTTGWLHYNFGTIRNVHFRNADLCVGTDDYIYDYDHGTSAIALIGHNYGTIENCTLDGNISLKRKVVSGKSGSWAAGFAAFNGQEGVIKDCVNSASVSLTVSADKLFCNAYVAGISSENYGSIEHCLNLGYISGSTKETSVYSKGVFQFYVFGICMPAAVAGTGGSQIGKASDDCGNGGTLTLYATIQGEGYGKRYDIDWNINGGYVTRVVNENQEDRLTVVSRDELLDMWASTIYQTPAATPSPTPSPTPAPTPVPDGVVPEGWTPIYTLADLQNASRQGEGQKMILMNNIDANQENFEYQESASDPYGVATTLSKNSIFDGNGHTIYNLKTGVFVENYGTLRNLNVTIHDTKEDETHLPQSSWSTFYYSGLVDYNCGMIENCNVKMTVHRDLKEENNDSEIQLGGLARGNYSGTIRNCIVDMDVDVRSIGGRSGVNSVEIAGLCLHNGNSGSSKEILGRIDHCLVMGKLQGTGDVYACSALGLTSILGAANGYVNECVDSACALELLSLTTNNEYYFSPAFETWLGSVDGVSNCRVASDLELVHNVPDEEKDEYIGVGYTVDSRANILADWDLSKVPGDTPVGVPTPTPVPTPSPTPEPTPAVPADALASGECGAQGDNVVWWVKDDTLFLSGSGGTADYSFEKESDMSPWYNYELDENVVQGSSWLRDNIYKIVVEDGITNLGDFIFYGMNSCSNISLGEDIAAIGEGSLAARTSADLDIIFTGKAPRYFEETAFQSGPQITIYCQTGMTDQYWTDLGLCKYFAYDVKTGSVDRSSPADLRWVFADGPHTDILTENGFFFKNDDSSLGFKEPKGYYITQKDYDRLTECLTDTERKDIIHGNNKVQYALSGFESNLNIDGKGKDGSYCEWAGSCHGMSAVVAAVLSGSLPASAAPGGPETINQLRMSKDVQSFVNYYHFQQELKAVRDKSAAAVDFKTQEEQISNLETLVKQCEEKGSAALISFDFYQDQPEGDQKKIGHAILGYAVEKGVFPMSIMGRVYIFHNRILTYEPGYAGKDQDDHDNALYYNKDIWAIPGWEAVSAKKGIDIFSFDNSAQLTGILVDSNYINAVDYLTGVRRYRQGRSSEPSVPGYIRTSSQNLTLLIDGEEVEIQNGLFGGTSTISDTGAMITFPKNGEEDGRYTIVLPEGAEYSVSAGEGFSCSLETDDFYLSAAAGGAGEISFDPAGTVDLSMSDTGNAYLGLTANDSNDWHNYEVTSSAASHLSLEHTDNGLEIWGDDLSDAAVAAYDQEDEAKELRFSTDESSVLVTEEDREVKLWSDPDEDGSYDEPLEEQKPTPTPASTPTPVPTSTPTPSPTPVPKEFRDVKPSDYFYKAVQWAVLEGITSGTSETTFSPNSKCTRGQIVTFLWHALDDPEPVTQVNPFRDVKPGDYYYKAVLWAYENGITSGTSATTFGPGAACTRGQVMTFLWNALERPEPETLRSPFTDVGEKNYFWKPVLWAYENKVTGGVGNNRFGPGLTCTRGQIVTFLYNGLGGVPPRASRGPAKRRLPGSKG